MRQLQTVGTKYRTALLLAITLIVLVVIYTSTLLTHISGGGNAYMDDVGEIQVALNLWGTVHYSGYPLYTIIGNLFTTGARLLGTYPAVAPVLYSMVWGLIALSIFFILILKLTSNSVIAAIATLLLGLTRSVWIHNVISEVYSMSLAFQVGLLTIALWPDWKSTRRQVWILALIGGLGVAHHRLVVLMAPGLLLAVTPGLIREHRAGKNALITLGIALLIGLLGFIPYLYLPARALAGSNWVYGHPETLQGFWREFTGGEASFLMHLPANGQAFTKDIADSFGIIITELTPIFALLGFISLIAVIINRRFCREGRITFVCSLGYFFFLFVLHRVVMPEAVAMPVVMMMVLSMALMTAISLPILSRLVSSLKFSPIMVGGITIAAFAVIVAIMLPAHQQFIKAMTSDTTGVKMIELAKRVPTDDHAVMMLPWGPRYTAVAFSKLITRVNAALRLVDHNADLTNMLKSGDVLYMPADTFYGPPFKSNPFALWRIPVYLSSGGEGLITVRVNPLTGNLENPLAQVTDGIVIQNVALCLTDEQVHVTVMWGAQHKPQVSLSVLVHLLGVDGDVPLTQADSSTPVYGWYPTTLWSAGEIIEDDYVLPHLIGASRVRIGMYEQKDGKFINYGLTTLSLDAAKSCTLSTTKN